MFDPTGKAAAAILAVLLVLLPVSCRDRADDLDLPAPFECDAGEGDWRSRVMAPGGPVVYPVKAAWIDPEGNTVELNPTDLGPEGSGILLNRGTLALDFGRNVAGFAELGIRDAGGLKFDLRFAEAQRFLWDLEVRPYEALTHLTIPPVWLPRYHLHELDGDHDLRDAVQVGSFRHVRMDVHRGWARLERFGVRFTSYRSTPDRLGGYFLCDEDLLSRIWYAGVYTLDLCTIRSDQGYSTANEIIGNGPWSVVDGGKRDRLIWTGDLFMGSRVDFVSRADHAPSIDSLDYLGSLADADGRLPGCSPVRAVGLGAYTFLEYNLFWILTAWDQYLYTGDLDKLTERYSVVRSVLGHLETMTDDGLIRLGTGSGGSWAWSLNRRGVGSFINVLYELSLQKAALMAKALGLIAEAGEHRASAAWVRELINRRLWDPDRGIYTESEQDRTHVPLDANAVAILSAAADGREARILDFLSAHHMGPYGLVNVVPYYQSTTWGVDFHNGRAVGFPNAFAAQALFETGRDKGALDLIRKCFGHMAMTDPASTMWEFIGADGEPEMAYVGLGHAWSAGATALLSRYVLGVRPTEPGYARFAIRPQTGDLERVEGRVPTPHGPVFVKLERTDAGLLAYVEVPEGTRAEVEPPGYASWTTDDGTHGDFADGPLVLSPGRWCLLFEE